MSCLAGPSLAIDREDTEPAPASGTRREARRDGLRQADYSPFPRMSLDAETSLALVLNESDAGLCLVVARNEPIGSLLRIGVRGLHGLLSRDVVARVVWSEESAADRYRLGLALLREAKPRMSRVRYEDGLRARLTG